MAYVLLFLAGLLLCNALPHLAAGLRGEVFPTPFAKPRGRGASSPLVNAVWGVANLAAGVLLVGRGAQVGYTAAALTVLAGVLGAATYLSLHFGRVRADGAL